MPLPGKFPVDAHECTCRYLAATQTCFQSEGEQDMFQEDDYVNADIVKTKRSVVGRDVK